MASVRWMLLIIIVLQGCGPGGTATDSSVQVMDETSGKEQPQGLGWLERFGFGRSKHDEQGIVFHQFNMEGRERVVSAKLNVDVKVTPPGFALELGYQPIGFQVQASSKLTYWRKTFGRIDDLFVKGDTTRVDGETSVLCRVEATVLAAEAMDLVLKGTRSDPSKLVAGSAGGVYADQETDSLSAAIMIEAKVRELVALGTAVGLVSDRDADISNWCHMLSQENQEVREFLARSLAAMASNRGWSVMRVMSEKDVEKVVGELNTMGTRRVFHDPSGETVEATDCCLCQALQIDQSLLGSVVSVYDAPTGVVANALLKPAARGSCRDFEGVTSQADAHGRYGKLRHCWRVQVKENQLCRAGKDARAIEEKGTWIPGNPFVDPIEVGLAWDEDGKFLGRIWGTVDPRDPEGKKPMFPSIKPYRKAPALQESKRFFQGNKLLIPDQL